MKDSFGNILVSFQRKPNLIESDRGREFNNINFQDFLNNNNIRHFSRKTSLAAVVLCNRTIRDILKGPVSEEGDSN